MLKCLTAGEKKIKNKKKNKTAKIWVMMNKCIHQYPKLKIIYHSFICILFQSKLKEGIK